jgi:hypothetical protein
MPCPTPIHMVATARKGLPPAVFRVCLRERQVHDRFCLGGLSAS